MSCPVDWERPSETPKEWKKPSFSVTKMSFFGVAAKAGAEERAKKNHISRRDGTIPLLPVMAMRRTRPSERSSRIRSESGTAKGPSDLK
jgi:hypothetical protein